MIQINRDQALTMMLRPIYQGDGTRQTDFQRGIRARIEHVSHAYPFMSPGEQKQADEWIAAAGKLLDELHFGRMV